MFPSDFLNGRMILIDKPLGWTSFDVVSKVRVLLRRKLGIIRIRAGHAGTLDPLATGLLILCTGKHTKNISNYQNLEKEYTGTITLGTTTPSYDKETNPDGHYSVEHITEDMLRSTANGLTGEIMQTPPLFSAIKMEGRPAYYYARKGSGGRDCKSRPVGENFPAIPVMKARKVTVHKFEITLMEMPVVHFRVVCEKGVYVRSLAHDLGKEVGSGAYLSSLCRTRIGPFELTDALSIEGFEKLLETLQKKQ